MASGRIRDFRKPDEESKVEPQILSQQRPSGAALNEQPQAVEVTVHEEVIREGQQDVRVSKENDGIEIRVRSVKDAEAWDRVKRGED